jgi:hypothetical protein
MEITEKQYEKIKDSLLVQRGNVRLTSLAVHFSELKGNSK